MPVSSQSNPSPKSTLFFTTLNANDQAVCAQMPAFFSTQEPCEEYFPQAMRFMEGGAPCPHQRGLAKRWIMQHLSDMEYHLQSIPWERYPNCLRYYTHKGIVKIAHRQDTIENRHNKRRMRHAFDQFMRMQERSSANSSLDDDEGFTFVMDSSAHR